jgi:hypothetical protein
LKLLIWSSRDWITTLVNEVLPAENKEIPDEAAVTVALRRSSTHDQPITNIGPKV